MLSRKIFVRALISIGALALPIVLASRVVEKSVQAAACPADERDGVRVQACQVGDDIQILVHNANNYTISVDTRTTYVDQGGSETRSSSGRINANYGGQIDLIQVRPYHSLKEVSDISIKDIVKR